MFVNITRVVQELVIGTPPGPEVLLQLGFIASVLYSP